VKSEDWPMVLETVALLALATLLSEDLACVAAGVLIAQGDLPPAAGVLGCAVGIFAGDCALWASGRVGGALLSRRRTGEALHIGKGWRLLWRPTFVAASERGGRWLERHAAAVIVFSRLTPGTRLPLYVAAGLVRVPFLRFALWTAVAVAVWTPAIVLASARAGEAGAHAGGSAGWTVVAALVGVVALTRAVPLLRRLTLGTRVARIVHRYRRWEFWPSWLFYAPVAGWIAWLALRHGGLRTLTACNPGIQDGGLVGESKGAILDLLPPASTIPHRRIAVDGLPGGAGPDRASDAAGLALRQMSAAEWSFPVVLKPDAGQRGVGVRVVRSREQLAEYLCAASGTILMQPFHPGPFEAGIFYYRFPDESRGRIFSITDKHFPVVVGDGVSTLRRLIESHPRYRLQSDVFFARHAARLDATPARGERTQLAIAGNHAQGTLFRNGWHLWTPALEAQIDSIARQVPGFFIGRFDVRYRDVDAFKAGRDLAIVELNGATAESTDIYDPDRTLVEAYRVLFRQWSLVFAIGAANRVRGAKGTSFGRLVRLVAAHLASSPAHALSD
jgi:membrane protein DedA with SNARE-associated domain